MPLALASAGAQSFVKSIGGKPETRQFLEKLGFVPGSLVTVISKTDGNVIVSVKDARVAISREMAAKIIV